MDTNALGLRTGMQALLPTRRRRVSAEAAGLQRLEAPGRPPLTAHRGPHFQPPFGATAGCPECMHMASHQLAPRYDRQVSLQPQAVD